MSRRSMQFFGAIMVIAVLGVPARAVFPAGRIYSGIKREDRRAGFEGLDPRQVAAAVAELLG